MWGVSDAEKLVTRIIADMRGLLARCRARDDLEKKNTPLFSCREAISCYFQMQVLKGRAMKRNTPMKRIAIHLGVSLFIANRLKADALKVFS